MDWSEFPKSTFNHQEPRKENEMDSGYGWCQSCGALVFNSPQCHKCDGKVKPFCVDIMLVKQAERIKELEDVIAAALRISDLWTLKEVETMFEDEAKALLLMKEGFEQSLKGK